MDDKEKPFSLAWLNSSYYETLFASTPWQNINDILSIDLAKAVRQQFNNPHRKQMIIELLGEQFKRSYLAEEVDNPHILYPPSMTEDQRKKLENEAKSWLQIQINEIALKKSCAIKPNEDEEQLCAEMKDYLEHTYNIISTSLDRHLYSKQKKINAELSEDLKGKGDKFKEKELSLLEQIARYSDKNDLRGTLKNKEILQNNANNDNSTKLNLSSEYSEMISAALLSILESSPRRTAFVLQKLNGQQLTNNLRKFIWSDILVRHEKKKLDTGGQQDVELLLRKKFANGVTRGKNELKLADPTQSPIAGLIENAVIETYSRIFSMSEMLSESHLRQTMKILNVLYTHSRDYEPYYIFWLLPFQLGFQAERGKSELIYDLAMYLDLFVKNFFPQWGEIFTISAKVMKDLSLNDPDFYEHLKRVSKINPKVSSKDFVHEIISSETKALASVSSSSAGESGRELLYDPIIFIRNWIGQCFAGVLGKNALLYVWDQLFMSLWSSYDFEVITKVLLYLLKSDFMAAFDFDDMRRVFLEHPSKLRTADIQSAFMHLSSGRKESEISFLNKSSTQSIAKNTGYYTKPTANGGSNSKKSNLDPIGFKNFQFTIIVPKVGSTSDFNPTQLIAEVSIHSGKYKLSQDETTSIALVNSVKASMKDTKIYEITIATDRLIFDLSEFEESRFGTNDIFALVQIKYHTDTLSKFYLGYCKIVLCTPEKIGNIFTWDITHGQVKKLLHPGVAPSNLSKINDTPKPTYKDRLGPGSCLTVNIFDSKYEQFLE